jgi:hypothetical protein
MLKFLGPIRQPPSFVSLSVIVQFILTSLSEPETEHRVCAAGPLIRHRTYEVITDRTQTNQIAVESLR